MTVTERNLKINSMIPNQKLNEILANAEKATKGNWKAEPCHVAEYWCKSISADYEEDGFVANGGCLSKEDADYIASIDPPTVKAIIEELLKFRQGKYYEPT